MQKHKSYAICFIVFTTALLIVTSTNISPVYSQINCGPYPNLECLRRKQYSDLQQQMSRYGCGFNGCLDLSEKYTNWSVMCHLSTQQFNYWFIKTKFKTPSTSCQEAFSYILEKNRDTQVWDRLKIKAMLKVLLGDIYNLIGNLVNFLNETISIIWIWRLYSNVGDWIGAIFQLLLSIVILIVDVLMFFVSIILAPLTIWF